MKNSLSDKELYKIWSLLGRGSHLILRARNKELKQYGISAIEAAVLIVVKDIANKATISDISRKRLRKSHTISSLVTRMERKGLLRKNGL